MNAPFTALDVIVFLVIVLSGILAMLRGFTREVLSILSWVVALGAAVYAYLNADLRAQATGLIQPDWLAYAVLIGATFVLVLVVVSFVTARLTDFILDSRVGAIDRTLGLVFGIARGMVLVAVAYLFFSWLVTSEQQPSWVLNAQARPYMEQSRDILESFLPDDPGDIVDMLPSGIRNLLRSGADDSTVPETDAPAGDVIDPDPTGGAVRERLPDGGRDALIERGSGAMYAG
jgi:membrane protein required for colicin V production